MPQQRQRVKVKRGKDKLPKEKLSILNEDEAS